MRDLCCCTVFVTLWSAVKRFEVAEMTITHESVVLVGVVAAAAQFIDIGCKVILHTSSLFSRFRDVPRCLQQVQDQVQLLLHLAELTSRKNMMQPLLNDSPQPIPLGTPRFPLARKRVDKMCGAGP